MRTLLGCVLCLAALAAPGVASAAQRISIGPVRGDRRAAIATQLAVALCPVRRCVLWPEISTRGRLDLAKARRLRVDGVLVGGVNVRAGSRFAKIDLLRDSTRPALSWDVAIGPDGRLDPAGVREISAALARLALESVPPRAPRPAARRPLRAPPADEPGPPPVISPAPAPHATRPIERAEPAPPERPAAAARPPPAPPPRARHPRRSHGSPGEQRAWLRAQAGLLLLRRELAYEGVSAGTAALRGHDAPAVVLLQVRLEVYPAAPLASGAPAGLGLVAGYERSVGLETEAPGMEKRPTTLSRVHGGILWRAPPLGVARVVLVPALTWEAARVSTSPSIPGLPDAHLSGLKGSLGVEVRLGGRIDLHLGGGWVRWLVAEDLVEGDPPFFPGGSASALEGEAGISYRLSSSAGVRITAEASRTRYDLDPDPTGRYAADGATDLRAGVRLGITLRL